MTTDFADPAIPFDPWPDCGHRLLEADARGWLKPTPAWLAAWLARPELALVAESCVAEIKLHQALQADPLRPVTEAELAAFKDADARENHAHFLALRDGLLAAGTLQAWLLALWRAGNTGTPPLFIDLVVQAVLRGLLADSDDAFTWRAAEMLFRPQRIARHEGRLLAGDRDTLDLQRETGGFGDLGRLMAQAGHAMKTTQMQVLVADSESDNRADYWREACRPGGRHAYLLDLTHDIRQELGHGLAFNLVNAHSGLKALAGVLERWVEHLLGVRVRIEPRREIEDAKWRWHVGLDVEASSLLDDLYVGNEVDAERQARLVSLFRLDFADPREMRADVAGKPVYLGLMLRPDDSVRIKPQNLLLNLPLAARS